MASSRCAPTDVALLAQAIDVWSRTHGYAYVEVPWLPNAGSAAASDPAERATVVTHPAGRLTSGEQGFLELWECGALPIAVGYVGWTPSIRDESAIEELHSAGSINGELFVPVCSALEARDALPAMVCREKLLLSSLAAKSARPCARFALVYISAHHLILRMNGLDVGSYRIRPYRGGCWYLYGTALALPRFRLALETVEEVDDSSSTPWPVARTVRSGSAAAPVQSDRGITASAVTRDVATGAVRGSGVDVRSPAKGTL